MTEDGTPISGVTFTLSELNGNLDSKTAVSDADGKVSFKNLDPGSYKITETGAPDYVVTKSGYLLATVTYDGTKAEGERFTGTIENVTGQELQMTVAAGTYQVQNQLSQVGCVKGTKKNEAGDRLSGAVIGIFLGTSQTVTDYSRENATMLATSGGDGTYQFNFLPEGNYVIAEVEAPSGYLLNEDTKIDVAVLENTMIDTDLLGNEIKIVDEVKPDDPQTPQTPQIPQNPQEPTISPSESSGSQTTAVTTSNTEQTADTTTTQTDLLNTMSVQTGDVAVIWPYILLAVVGTGLIIIVIFYGHNRRKGGS